MAELIASLTMIFIASAVMLMVSQKFSQPAIPAYLSAGIIVGIFIDQLELLSLAQIGVAFLVFIFGLKFDPEKLTAVRNEALAVNSLQVILIGTLSFVFALTLGLEELQALYFSVAATLSSSLIGLELISKEIDKNLVHGRLAESINLIQDIFAVAAIVVLSSSQLALAEISHNIAIAGGMIIIALAIRKLLLEKIGKMAKGSSELLMLTGLSFLTVFIAISQYFGLSIVVGSFTAGIAVARFPHNLEILDTMGSVKDFFAAIFFVTLGTLLSVPNAAVLLMTAGLAFLTSIAKPGLVILSLVHQGYDPRTSFMTGVSLDQISEFSLIIAIQGWIAGTIAEPLFQAIVLSATITMTTSSYTKKYESRLFDILDSQNFIEHKVSILPETNTDKEISDHIILIGYDTQGKRIVEQLETLETDFLIVENDPEKISELRKKNENFVYGNIMEEETWKHAKPEEASLIISTAPFPEVSEKILALDSEAGKILRSGELEDARELVEKGADYVIVPEILTAELLKEHLLGLESEENYKEELRRRSLLEVRRYIESEEG